MDWEGKKGRDLLDEELVALVRKEVGEFEDFLKVSITREKICGKFLSQLSARERRERMEGMVQRRDEPWDQLSRFEQKVVQPENQLWHEDVTYPSKFRESSFV